MEAGERRHRCWVDFQIEKGWEKTENESCVKSEGIDVKQRDKVSKR